MTESMRIAIIGGGATGALAALHLSGALPDGQVQILVVEPAPRRGADGAGVSTIARDHG